jgi:hypothetical protein
MGTLEWQRGAKTYERDEGHRRSGRQITGSQVWTGGEYDGQFAESLPNGCGVYGAKLRSCRKKRCGAS